MGKRISWLLTGLGMALLLCSSCTPTTPPGGAWQQTVDALAALKPGEIPPHLLQEEAVRDGSEFDPNAYFTVLTHLAMEPGYVVDYVYSYDFMAGLPMLYARPAGQAPYADYAAYSAAVGDPSTQRSSYLDRVRADGTPEGFFEWVVLYINGGQFYLSWHANYNDVQLVCDGKGLEALVARMQGGGLALPDDVVRSARKLDYTPVVELQGDTVRVRVVTFSKWGGFAEEVYTLQKEYPHTLLDVQTKELVPYDCGIQF